jgi:murein DD-endopeptidase MepM/ murein hydrolase activator NlpD
MNSRQSGRAAAVLLLLLALAGLAFLGLAAFRTGPEPEIKIAAGLPAIGKRTPLTVSLSAPGRGLAHVRVELRQGARTETLADKSYDPPPPWRAWKTGTTGDELKLEVGRETVKGLTGEPVTIRVTADRAGSWLRHPAPASAETTLPVRLHPPTLQLLSNATYVTQGGSEAVVYRVGESALTHGVRAGERFFPGFPLPGGGPTDRFALFAAPHDLTDPRKIQLVATDDVGNEATVSFVDKFFPREVRSDVIQVTDDFLGKVVPEIMSQTPDFQDRGSPLANYLAINGELRKANAAELTRMSESSRPSFLWSRRFEPMPNGKVMSSFADRRTYVYQGKTVDHQDHLGFDLASTRGAPVPSANDGVVVLARYFGIYGNTVIVDHGYGLMTLYGHLSSIDVAEGREVKRGDPLGKSGQTGLAGGDHLHFSVLLHGVSVNPTEWWDEHWIRDRIVRKLGTALPFMGS